MKRTSLKNREKVESKKQRNKTTALFVTLIVLAFIGIALIVFYVTSSTSMRVKEDVYQYYIDVPVTFEKGTTFSSEYMEVTSNSRANVGNTPLYSTTDSKIYLPRNYVWENPSTDEHYRVPEFSSIVMHSAGYFDCTANLKTHAMKQGFLFDEGHNFIFLDKGTVALDDFVYDVSPLSFYSYEYGVTRIYDYAKDKLYFVEGKQSTAKYQSNTGYTVYLNKGMVQTSDNTQYLLVSSTKNVDSIEERSE